MPHLEIREGSALGSRLRLSVAPSASASTAGVDAAWAAVQEVVDEVDRAMSRFRDDSELTLLNRRLAHRAGATVLAAPAFIPSRALAAALVTADRARRMTGGRFDARVVVDLERLGAAGMPQGAAGASLGAAGDPRAHALRRASRPLVAREGRGPLALLAAADLGGLGKGLALRWARSRAAAELGDASFLLDAGGDITSSGMPVGLGEPGWSIGIEDPATAGQVVATVELRPDQSIATSSVRIGRWAAPDGRAVHHLIDPSTGEPGGAGLRAVTVAWPDPAWAEVWSKALFLEGAHGIAMAARRRGLAAWWVDDAGELSMTPAARVQTTWVRSEASSAA
ncbi:MAG TPA: FAD:protein FMN transferase [Candidatus Limnocylindrales bacterium]|nr:FAD:protein FMN transferase [Candidatus Limnocylindrales bacterium]